VCNFFVPVTYLGVWILDKCITEGWWWYSETSEITILCSKQTEALLISAFLQQKILYFVLI